MLRSRRPQRAWLPQSDKCQGGPSLSAITENRVAPVEKTVTSGSATKIVVLDGYALNPGDLSWDALKELGSSEIYDRTPEELVVERAGDADAVLASKTLLSGATLRTLSKLRYIGVLGTGYNNVDIKAAKELGIAVANVPTYGTASVAQF